MTKDWGEGCSVVSPSFLWEKARKVGVLCGIGGAEEDKSGGGVGKKGGGGGGEGGLNGLRPSRAAAWISNLDVCEGSILFEFFHEIWREGVCK